MSETASVKTEGTVTLDALVQDLLGLDPGALVRLGNREPSEGDLSWGATSRAGLNVMMRRVLEMCGTLVSQENAFVRLETQDSATAAGWPDARTANLALLLTWGMLGDNRMREGLPAVPLLAADANVVPWTQHRWRDGLAPASELIRKVIGPARLSLDNLERGQALWANPVPVHQAVASTNRLIKDTLGLDPLLLARDVPAFRDEPDTFFDKDPELKGWAGLNKLLLDVLTQYWKMEERKTSEVRLMGDHDARDAGRPSARSANVALLLSAGLMCEDDWEVMLFPVRPFSQEREDLLEAVAREAILSKSMYVLEAFRRLCDGMTHFGVHAGGSKAQRLLQVAYEDTKSSIHT